MLEPNPLDDQDAAEVAESLSSIFDAEADGIFDLSPAARKLLLDVYDRLQQKDGEPT